MQFAESSSLWDRSFRPVQTHQEISAEGGAVANCDVRRVNDLRTSIRAILASHLGCLFQLGQSFPTASKLIFVDHLSHL